MRPEPVWLDRRIVEALHEQVIQEYGGTAGIRDAGLLESAVGPPRNKWAYEEAVDLSLLAESCAYGLARNHPLVDGNKRIAATAIGIFLGLNGLELEAPEPELVSAILAIATGEWTEDELAVWIRDHTIPLAGDSE